MLVEPTVPFKKYDSFVFKRNGSTPESVIEIVNDLLEEHKDSWDVDINIKWDILEDRYKVAEPFKIKE